MYSLQLAEFSLSQEDFQQFISYVNEAKQIVDANIYTPSQQEMIPFLRVQAKLQVDDMKMYNILFKYKNESSLKQWSYDSFSPVN